MAPLPTREQAWSLLNEYTKSDRLLKHALSVEATMGAYAERFGEDAHLWRITGLIHDFDFEQWPDAPAHTAEGARILREQGWPEEIVRAVLAHADYSGVPRDTLMARTLFAADELSGFVMAVAYVRPSRKVADVEVQSVKKKMKDKAFARAISREDIVNGAADLGIPLDEHIRNVIDALAGSADALGL